MTPEQTLTVLEKLAEEFGRLRGVSVEAGVLPWLLDFAARFLRNRHFPDKAVDLLEQCVAHAVATGKTRLDAADAEAVAERMIGQPLAADAGTEALTARLAERTLLMPEDSLAIVNRLSVTARGLDVRPSRPNAVVILLGKAAHQRDALAETLAETLFGSTDRIVSIDFARFVTQYDVSALLGSAPGYVGYSDSLPIHRLLQMPWCVLCCDNVHLSHPAARDILAQALAAGVITDASGKRIYLSDVIVLLTAGGSEAVTTTRTVRGFRPWDSVADTPETPDARTRAEGVLGVEFVALADVVCADVVPADAARARWVEDHLMSNLAERFRRQGLSLSWDAAVVGWLLARTARSGQLGVERLIDEHVSSLLISHLPPTADAGPRTVTLCCEGDHLRVDRQGPGGGP
jgi:ATP-dependent Clp protease ATP-binding subunit ClpC